MTAREIESIKAELRAELLAELLAEQDRKARSKTMFRELMDKRETELSLFNWGGGIKPQHVARDAIGALLRVIYKQNYAARLPAEYEADIAEFVDLVIALMKEFRFRMVTNTAVEKLTQGDRSLIAEMAEKSVEVTLAKKGGSA